MALRKGNNYYKKYYIKLNYKLTMEKLFPPYNITFSKVTINFSIYLLITTCDIRYYSSF